MIKWVSCSILYFISSLCMMYNSYMSFNIMKRQSTGKVAKFFLRILVVLFAALSVFMIVLSIGLFLYILRR